MAPERSYIDKIKGEAKSPEQMADFLQSVVDIDFNLGTESFRNFVDKLRTSSDEEAIKSFYVEAAKALGHSGVKAWVLFAMDLYRQLLTVDPENLYSHYPFLLDFYDYKKEAGCLWFRCHQESPTKISEFTMKGYVKYLKDAGRPDLAENAENSEVLDIQEPIIIKTDKSLPDRFSTITLPSLTDIFCVIGKPYSCYQTAINSINNLIEGKTTQTLDSFNH
jgi:hypothetical protein